MFRLTFASGRATAALVAVLWVLCACAGTSPANPRRPARRSQPLRRRRGHGRGRRRHGRGHCLPDQPPALGSSVVSARCIRRSAGSHPSRLPWRARRVGAQCHAGAGPSAPSGTIMSTITVSGDSVAATAEDGSAWVAAHHAVLVYRIDPATATAITTSPDPDHQTDGGGPLLPGLAGRGTGHSSAANTIHWVHIDAATNKPSTPADLQKALASLGAQGATGLAETADGVGGLHPTLEQSMSSNTTARTATSCGASPSRVRRPRVVPRVSSICVRLAVASGRRRAGDGADRPVDRHRGRRRRLAGRAGRHRHR